MGTNARSAKREARTQGQKARKVKQAKFKRVPAPKPKKDK